MADDGAIPDQDPVLTARTSRPRRAERWALAAGLVVVVLLAGLVSERGFRAYQAHNTDVQRKLFVSTARQAATNLTTYDYQHIDVAVHRILELATGTFYDTFSHRVQPFEDLVGQAHSTSVGTVTEAGLEAEHASEGRVLVAVSVQASDVVGGAEQRPQALRMRITVKKMGNLAKVSDVVFVP